MSSIAAKASDSLMYEEETGAALIEYILVACMGVLITVVSMTIMAAAIRDKFNLIDEVVANVTIS